MLTKEDIKFLAKKTKLSAEKAQSLFEEKTDSDLVLEQISNKRLTKKELLELSFPIFIKILINREMKDIDQKYKNYVSDFVGVFYPQIMLANRIKTKVPRKPSEENAQYFFTLASFFEEDMVAQMNVQQVHKILKYTMDTFAEKKGKDYVEAISTGYEYFSKIRKKWMS
tara:strand:+ start:1086 stop:1592 length:507 start_codon:yes stop_codon:yes gene_type:complete